MGTEGGAVLLRLVVVDGAVQASVTATGARHEARGTAAATLRVLRAVGERGQGAVVGGWNQDSLKGGAQVEPVEQRERSGGNDGSWRQRTT